MLIGVRPDLTVEVAYDVLAEIDGPILRHGLQDLHGHAVRALPATRCDQPRRDLLEWRDAAFRDQRR